MSHETRKKKLVIGDRFAYRCAGGSAPGISTIQLQKKFPEQVFSRNATMRHAERFRAVMNFQPVDRLPRWEWAMWWDQTIARWHGEGLPVDKQGVFDIHAYFGLDPYIQFWFSTTDPTIEASQHHVEGIVSNMDDYARLRPRLLPDHSAAIKGMAPWFARQEKGDAVVWITLEGYFWFPRTLMGFEKLMFAYYDQPELLHRINQDLLDFNLQLLDMVAAQGRPVFMTVAEDMSYNNGPMVSREICDEFMTPYYQKRVYLKLLNEYVTGTWQ